MQSRLPLVVGSVFLAAIALACGGGTSGSYSNPTSPTPTASSGAPADVTITIVGMNGSNSYAPNPATVKAGQTVAWKNGDGVQHTATADAGAFDTGTVVASATSRAIAMGVAGTYPYHCTIHGVSMAGTLIVAP